MMTALAVLVAHQPYLPALTVAAAAVAAAVVWLVPGWDR